MKKRFYKFVCVGLVLLLIFSLAACQNGQNPNEDSGTDSLTESSDTQSERESESESETETESRYRISGQSGSWDDFLEELEANKDRLGDHAQEKIELMSHRLEDYHRLEIIMYECWGDYWTFIVQVEWGYVDIAYNPRGQDIDEESILIDEENQIYHNRHTGAYWIHHSDTFRTRIVPREDKYLAMKAYALELFRMASQWE